VLITATVIALFLPITRGNVFKPEDGLIGNMCSQEAVVKEQVVYIWTY